MKNMTAPPPARYAARYLESRRIELIDAFLAGRAPDFMQRNSQLLDDFFIESFESSAAGPVMDLIRNPYAMIALGGYGRQEQCLNSDIDLLFLFKKKVPAAAEELIREIVYPLWDLGFEVGYATRSLKECVDIAAKDYEVMTSLLDSRFICGVSLLYSQMKDLLRKKLLLSKGGRIISWLIDRNLLRHAHFGDSSYLLEPNLKEGQGGLRDYHTMLWIGKIKFGFNQPRDFEFNGYFSHEEYAEFRRALSFIWKVRSHLHYLSGRKCDQLYFEYQRKIASIFQYRQLSGQKPVERFLGELHGNMALIKFRYLMFIHETGYGRKTRGGRKPERISRTAGIEVRKDTLCFSYPERILEDPLLLIRIFEESAQLKIPLNSEAQRLVKEFSYLIDDAFRKNPEAVKSFEKILSLPAPVFNVLNAMLMTGFLAKFIPDFEALTNRIQYNEYHIHSVDKHSLRTVRILKRFGAPEDNSGDPLCGQLYRQLKNRKCLLWAALLHDIGKGRTTEDHSSIGAQMAQTLLENMGYDEKDTRVVSELIQYHLLLMKVASRRDLNDEETALFCAQHVKSIEHLKMLYLLTVADAVATGPKAWNEWSSVLLRELFLKVYNIIEKGELASEEAVGIIKSKKAEILQAFAEPPEKKSVATLLEQMSPRYLLAIPTPLIREHVNLHSRLGDKEFVWEIKKFNGSDTRTIIVCAKDRPGLFSKIAGVLTLSGVNILDAQIFTWKNNTALDIFEVSPPPDLLFEQERWQRAEKNLTETLAGEFDITTALKNRLSQNRIQRPHIAEQPHRVVVDNDTSSFFSIVEVFTYDFPGLLFGVTDALFRCGLDIWVAKIATKVDQVVDVFYVRDLNGQKVTDPDRVAEIKCTLMDILPDIDVDE